MIKIKNGDQGAVEIDSMKFSYDVKRKCSIEHIYSGLKRY